MKAMSEQEVEALAKATPGWSVDDGKLLRDWKFVDFAEAMIFVNKVAEMAEEVDHHPDIDIRYNQVRLALVSHDARGVTSRDAKMAARLSERFPMNRE